MQRVQQADSKTARAGQPGGGGQVSDGADVNGRIDFQQPQGFTRDVVFDFIDRLDQFGAGIINSDRFAIEFAVALDRDIDVLVNRGAENGAVIALVKVRQIGAATGKAHPQGSARDDDSGKVLADQISHASGSNRKESPS